MVISILAIIVIAVSYCWTFKRKPKDYYETLYVRTLVPPSDIELDDRHKIKCRLNQEDEYVTLEGIAECEINYVILDGTATFKTEDGDKK